jgi:dTDP-4-dehydrorhamnose reductase
MRIAVIGVNGQLGSDCKTLLSTDNETVGCDIPEVNIASRESVDTILNKIHPDVIINCAAYTAVDDCEKETTLSWQINADGPKYLAQAAERLNSRLIHISTDYVFDGRKEIPEPYLETDTPNPLSQYGRSKLAGEKMVSEYASNHSILRTAWLYSATGKNFLKTMLKLAVSDPDRELQVVNDQYGSLTWSYTLALQIQNLLHSDLNGIMHTTAEGYSSWYEAARYFLDGMAVPYTMSPCTTAEYPTPAHRPANSILANQALLDAGLSTFVNWQEDIDTFIARYKDQLMSEANTGKR